MLGLHSISVKKISIFKNNFKWHEHFMLIFQIWNPKRFSHSSGTVIESKSELGTSAWPVSSGSWGSENSVVKGKYIPTQSFLFLV